MMDTTIELAGLVSEGLPSCTTASSIGINKRIIRRSRHQTAPITANTSSSHDARCIGSVNGSAPFEVVPDAVGEDPESVLELRTVTVLGAKTVVVGLEMIVSEAELELELGAVDVTMTVVEPGTSGDDELLGESELGVLVGRGVKLKEKVGRTVMVAVVSCVEVTMVGKVLPLFVPVNVPVNFYMHRWHTRK